MQSRQIFGKNLKLVRSTKNLTQKNVAQASGIHVNYYARIERGKENPSFEAIEKIVKALGIKSSDVLPF
jgi:transcriptional regulator with XRE-family HTH domain